MRGALAAIQGGGKMRTRWLPTDSKRGLIARPAIVGAVAWAILALGLVAATGAAHAQSAYESPVGSALLDAALADAASSARLAVQSQTSAVLEIAAATSINPGAHGWDQHWLWVSLAVAPLLLLVFLWLRDRLSSKVPIFTSAGRSRS